MDIGFICNSPTRPTLIFQGVGVSLILAQRVTSVISLPISPSWDSNLNCLAFASISIMKGFQNIIVSISAVAPFPWSGSG